MKSPLDPHDRQFLEILQRLEPATVQELCSELGVTATAVRQRLTRLQGRSLVTRRVARQGRGRPHHQYEMTEAGLRELGNNYADLALILWNEVRNIEEPALRDRLVQRIEEGLVEQYGETVEGRSLKDRVRQLIAALVERGFDVEADSSGELPILRENHCPYWELATVDSRICHLEQAVFSRVLGTELTLTHCCLNGDSCCEFEPVSAEDESSER